MTQLRLEEIYDAAFDDEGFEALPGRLAQVFKARSALIHWIHDDGEADILSHSGYFTNEQLADYALNFVAIDPWVAAAAGANQVNSVLNLEELVPVAQFTGSDFYNDYVRAMGDDTCRCLGIRLHNKSGTGYLALQRGLTQRAFDQATAAELSNYLPHLTRMLSIRGKLALAKHSAATLSAGLDSIALPIFLVDRRLRVTRMNRSAEDLLRQTEALKLRNGILRAAALAADEALHSAVYGSFNGSPDPRAIALPCATGDPLYLTIAPGRTEHRRTAVIMAHSQAATIDNRAGRLRSLFGLSPTEAALAVMLADGHSAAEIAERRGVAIATVRNQIKHIAAKLGCSRQSEIVKAVSALPPLFTAD